MAPQLAAASSLLQQFHVIPGVLGQCFRRWASSQFNGVFWKKTARKFYAQVYFNKAKQFAGAFESEIEAAAAYDMCLRSLGADARRLSRSLNFPTASEASYTETAQDARARSIALHSDKLSKEEASMARVQEHFQSAPQASTYEIVRVPGASRVDAVFQPRGSCIGGVPLQVKSSTLRAGSYIFNRTRGYAGMLLILVPLDCKTLWAVPGNQVTQLNLHVRPGAARSLSWQVQDLGSLLERCFRNSTAFPHMSLPEACLSCGSHGHRVEQRSHALMVKLFLGMGARLRKSFSTETTVDSLLRVGGCEWRVQEKAAQFGSRRGRYSANLAKHGGALGRQPYKQNDFDLLLVALLDDWKLSGVFAFPVEVMAEVGLVGQKPLNFPLHPPWALPKTEASRTRHAWQLDYFVDLRDWNGELPLPDEKCRFLRRLFQTLAVRKRLLDASWALPLRPSGD